MFQHRLEPWKIIDQTVQYRVPISPQIDDVYLLMVYSNCNFKSKRTSTGSIRIQNGKIVGFRSSYRESNDTKFSFSPNHDWILLEVPVTFCKGTILALWARTGSEQHKIELELIEAQERLSVPNQELIQLREENQKLRELLDRPDGVGAKYSYEEIQKSLLDSVSD